MKPNDRKATEERQFSLPDLTNFDGGGLEMRRDYDALDFVDRDFTGQDASDARFLECRLVRCVVDGLSFRRTRVLGSLVADVHGASVDFSDSTWRESRMSGGRLGAVNLPGATLTAVRIKGSKLGYLNLSGAHLDDVTFEGCEIGDLDARGATLRSVTFIDCSINELNVTEARLSKVDLSAARLRSLVGVDNLRGAIISHEQLVDLAPLLAAQLGLEVRSSEPGSE